ncbi:MAG: pitrilysin family protein [Melioribacteraceae bacterium]
MSNYNITKLPSGITLATEQIDYVKSFSLGFWFNVGSRDETGKTNGISHLLEHMFFKGTQKRTARKISEEIESLGGYLNAFTSKEHTCFYGRGLSQHIDKTFDVLSDMVQNSLFEKDELAKESKVVIDELKDIEDYPEELIFDVFETNVFKGNSLSMPIIGSEKNVGGFKRKDLLSYSKNKYGANNLVITASGAVSHDKIINMIEKHFEHRKRKTNDTRLHIKDRKKISFKTAKDLFIQKNINQAHIIIGGTTYGYKHKERAVINLISIILGEGSSSRLFQSLREKNGIAYQVNSFMNSFWDTSSFGVYLSTNDESLPKAKVLIEKEFEKLRTKKITHKELKKAKEYIKGSLELSLESTSNRMIRMGSSLLYYGKVKSVENSIKEIEAVTREEILEYSQKLLNPKNLSNVVISSKNILN